ncbi:cell wall hydrolase [Heyndrickxia sp. NPDC080065]|uniref:cell wall hydrolase n=1 Tax=Heyndrickxia sp. NPDC080065 TaxID=3390568 RepID=UPI003CFD2238
MFKRIALALVASISLLGIATQSMAASNTYTVKSGDTYWNLASKYGVTISELKKANNKQDNVLKVGQNLVIPNSFISEADKDLMARLVFAEAKGEPYAGKVAVATVVLNRLSNQEFPNTISGIINQVESGHYAFTPVQNGSIKTPADSASKKAVNEALALRGQGNGSIYFYNPKTAKSKWVFSRTVITKIGNHVFAK